MAPQLWTFEQLHGETRPKARIAEATSAKLLKKPKNDRGEQTNIRDVKNCKVKGFMVNVWGRDIDLDNAWLVSSEVQTDGLEIE